MEHLQIPTEPSPDRVVTAILLLWEFAAQREREKRQQQQPGSTTTSSTLHNFTQDPAKMVG